MEKIYNIGTHENVKVLTAPIRICEKVGEDYEAIDEMVRDLVAQELWIRADYDMLWSGDGWLVTNFDFAVEDKVYHVSVKVNYTYNRPINIDDDNNVTYGEPVVDVKSIDVATIWDSPKRVQV